MDENTVETNGDSVSTAVADPPKRKTGKKAAPKKAAVKKAAPKKASKPVAKKSSGNNVSVDKLTARAADVLRLAGDGTRLRILRLLANDRVNVGSIADSLGQAQPAVSHHIALLRASGVIEGEREGKETFYQPTAIGTALLDAVAAVAEVIESNE